MEKGKRSQLILGETPPIDHYLIKDPSKARLAVGILQSRKAKAPTALDLPSVPVLNTQEAFLNIIKSQLPQGELETGVWLGKIKRAAMLANKFLREVLDVPRVFVPEKTDITDNDLLEELLDIDNPQDLAEFAASKLSDINSSRPSSQKQLEQIRACMFAKTISASYELLNRRFEILSEAKDFLERALRGEIDDIPQFVEQRKGKEGDFCDNSTLMYSDALGVKVKFCSRAKAFNSALLKLIIYPEANIETALKDGVGMRIEANLKELPLIVESLVQYLDSQKASLHINSKLLLEVKGNLLDTNFLKYLNDSYDIVQFKGEDKKNKKSASKYKDIKLRFKILYEGQEVSVEVQLVHAGHRNEQGLANHLIYDLYKYIIAMQRLAGFVPKRWLDYWVNKVSKATKISPNNIIESLEQGGHIRKLLVGKRKTPIYVVPDIFNLSPIVPERQKRLVKR